MIKSVLYINIDRGIRLGLLGLLLCLCGCQSPEGFKQGKRAYLAGSFAEAEHHFQAGLRQDGDEVYYRNLLKSSQRIQAQKHLEQALNEFSLREYNSAQQSLESALAKDPDLLLARVLLLNLDKMMQECEALIEEGHRDLAEGRLTEGYRALKLASAMDKIYPNLNREIEEIEISTKQSAENVATFQFDQENYKEALEAWADYVSFAGIDAVSEEKIRESLRGMKVIRNCSDIQKFLKVEGYAKAYEMAVETNGMMENSEMANTIKKEAAGAYADIILVQSEAQTLKATNLNSRPDAFTSFHAAESAREIAAWDPNVQQAYTVRSDTLDNFLQRDISSLEKNLRSDDLPALWALEQTKIELISPEDEGLKQRLNLLKDLSLDYGKVHLAFPPSGDPQQNLRTEMMVSALKARKVPHLGLHRDDPNSVTRKIVKKNEPLFQQASLAPRNTFPRVYKPILIAEATTDLVEEAMPSFPVQYFIAYQFPINEDKNKAWEMALNYQQQIDALYEEYAQQVQEHEKALQQLVDCQNIQQACSEVLREIREMKSTQKHFHSLAQSNGFPGIASSALSTLNEIEKMLQNAQTNEKKAGNKTERAQTEEAKLKRQLQRLRMKLDDLEKKAIKKLALHHRAFFDLVDPQVDTAWVHNQEVSLDGSLVTSLTMENTCPGDKPVKILSPPVSVSYRDEIMTGAPRLSVDVGLGKSYQHLNDHNDLPAEEEVEEFLLCRANAQSGFDLYRKYLELVENDLQESRQSEGREKLAHLARYWLLATGEDTNTGFAYTIDPKVTEVATTELTQAVEALPAATE